MPKDKEQIKKLSKKLLDNGGSTSLAQLEATMDVTDKLEELTQKLEPKEIGDNATFIVKGLKGDKGDKHSDEEVIELIKPLIPEPLKGEDGKDGKDSTVPGPKGDKGDKGEPGKDGRDGVDGIGTNGKDGSPDTPDQVIEKVKSSQLLIPLEKLGGLSDFEKRIKADISVPQTTSLINGTRAKNINFTGASVSFQGDTATIAITGGGGGGSGDVVGPTGATDNAIARFDTATGKLIQDSVVTIADTTGNMAGVGTINTLVLPTSNFVGVTDTQSLSNKTLDEPKFVNGGLIKDGNGNELFIFTTTPAAVNELTFANAATGNAPKFTASGGDANININFVPKGAGTLQVNGTPVLTAMTVAGSGTELQYRSSATSLAALTGSSVSGADLSIAGGLTITPTASTGSPTRPLTVTAPAHTALTASTEFTNINLNLSATQQFSTGALTKQTAFQILAPTYSFVGASTISDAATLYIDAAPTAGTNATITRKYAIWADAGRVRFDEEIHGGNGGSSAPTFSFVSDTGTGFYRVAAGRLGTAISGTGQIDISSTYIGGFGSNDFRILHSNGLSATVPTYGFFTSTTSGMSMSAANTLNLITNGATSIEIDSAQKVSIGGQAPVSTLDVRGSFSAAYVAKTANYTATVSDRTIECTANTFQVTLPTAVGIKGREYIIVNSGAGTITIGTTSSQTFVNVVATPTTLTLPAVGSYRVQSNGANWMVI